MFPNMFFGSTSELHDLMLYPKMVFCAGVGLSFARTLAYMIPFYSWLDGSGLAISKLRGYGQTACGFFGIVPAPHLSVQAFGLAGVVLSIALFVLCLPMLPPTYVMPLCALSLAAYHCYMSQLYPESGTRASVTCVIPMALLFLMLSPAGLGDVMASDVVLENRASAFSVWMIKGMMFWAYFAAGVSKVKSSAKAQRAWWDGATLQSYIFEALFLCKPYTFWSYGILTPFTHELQRFVLVHRGLICAPLSVATMIIELGAPLTALLPFWCSPFFSFFGLGLHFGIAYLQNIDFLSWWGPVYAFFLLDPAAVCSVPEWYSLLNVSDMSCGTDPSLFGIVGAAEAAFTVAPVRAALSIAVLGTWVVASVALHFGNGLELLPLSKFGMFDAITDLFDGRTRNKIWLSEKRHGWGTLNNYVFGPYYRAPNVMPEEYDLLPYRYLHMVYGGNDPHDGIIYANFDVPEELVHHLYQIRAQSLSAPASDLDTASENIYQHLRAAQTIFDGLSAESKYSAKKVRKIPCASLDTPLLGS